MERPRIIKAIAEARAHGDLSENAEYHAAKEAQGLNEAKVADLEDKLSRADVIDVSKLSGRDGKVRRHGRPSLTKTPTKNSSIRSSAISKPMFGMASCPSARLSRRALIGKKAGDSVEVTTPKGLKAYEILKIKYRVTCFASADSPERRWLPKSALEPNRAASSPVVLLNRDARAPIWSGVSPEPSSRCLHWARP